MKWIPFTQLSTAIFVMAISQPTLAQSLNISTWNIEWLTNTPVSNVDESKRDKSDFKHLGNYFDQLSPDILAFQEVDSEAAITKVTGADYQIVMSDRALPYNSKHQFSDINQYTGFAIRNNIEFKSVPDLRLDTGSSSKLRFASYVILNPSAQQPIHMLSVHLKARCNGAYRNNRHCKTLKSQTKYLNQWIKQRESQGHTYIIMGDFNHNLSYKGDWMWEQLSASTHANLSTRYVQPKCRVKSKRNKGKTRTYPSVIDHIVTSQQIASTHSTQHLFDQKAVLSHRLSDHCAVSASVSLK